MPQQYASIREVPNAPLVRNSFLEISVLLCKEFVCKQQKIICLFFLRKSSSRCIHYTYILTTVCYFCLFYFIYPNPRNAYSKRLYFFVLWPRTRNVFFRRNNFFGKQCNYMFQFILKRRRGRKTFLKFSRILALWFL